MDENVAPITTAANLPIIPFIALAIMMIISALGTVFSRNPIHSVLFLVTNLMGVAAIYAGLSAEFLAVVQIVVYAGAIVVLFLFVVMLLNVKAEDENLRQTFFSRPSTWISISIALAFILVINFAFITDYKLNFANNQYSSAATSNLSGSTSDLLSNGEVEVPKLVSKTVLDHNFGSTKNLGRLLFSKYVFLFEIISMLLIAAMAATVMLAGKRKDSIVLGKQKAHPLGRR